MKKGIIRFSLIFLIFAIIIIVIYFGFVKVDIRDLVNKNISEMGEFCFSAQNSISDVKIYTGKRENPYLLNGVHEQCKPFALLTFRTNELDVQSPTFIAQINDQSYNGILEQNPYDNTFVTDLEVCIPEDAQIKVTITIKNNQYEYDVKNINKDWNLTFEDAKNIGIEHLTNEIQKCKKGKKINAEFYVKAITDTNGLFDSFYYYVSMIDTEGNSHNIVIDVNSGEIIN